MGIFMLFNNRFKIEKYVFELVTGAISLADMGE